HFEVVAFTAGLAEYAAPIIDHLDPAGLISHRLYREDTTVIGGVHIKDLARLNRDLAKIIIVDNSPESYALQARSRSPIYMTSRAILRGGIWYLSLDT
ncbi:HAD-like domain-containing protein, partial [Baffinella frigidus]